MIEMIMEQHIVNNLLVSVVGGSQKLTLDCSLRK